ncbi:MAG: hypothetical protein ACRC9Q_03435 [Bacteroidales bacterium]
MLVRTFITIICSLVLSGCENSETLSRIPEASVNLRVNIDYWKLTALLDYHRFLDKQGLPASTYLGYGGILVVNGFTFNGESEAFYAYDLACPVEAQTDVRVTINNDLIQAECPKCKSRFAVFEGGGVPVWGEAKKNSLFLKQYKTKLSGRDILISR